MKATNLTAERLRELLHYDLQTGVFTWKVSPTNCVHVGDVAGGVNRGRRVIRVEGRCVSAGPLAVFYVTGKWPETLIYRDGDRLNTTLTNLVDIHALHTGDLTQEVLKATLDYNPETGAFKWKVGYRGVVRGREPGCITPNGYRMIRLGRTLFMAHTLAWFYMYGEWPDLLDHKNRSRSDNRIDNLRLATPSQNLQNTGLRSDNKSGVKGVGWDKTYNLWRAHIGVNHVSKHLGRYATFDDAVAARKAAEAKYHPYATKDSNA